MFITLNQWYCRNSTYGYTKTILVNVDEISEIAETHDPYHNADGSYIAMKNGNHYNVKEDVTDIARRIQEIAERTK